MTEFTPFPKVPRLSRECVITEKIDGTNVSVWITNSTEFDYFREPDTSVAAVPVGDDTFYIQAGSRSRFITPGKTTDNFGFARWVQDNAEELVKLGEGAHYGEWWGSGIQRGYGLDEKRFSLFDVSRWHHWSEPVFVGETRTQAPSCCHVVPTLFTGEFEYAMALMGFNMSYEEGPFRDLAMKGSKASPGFMNPEGIMLYHTAANQYFKKTFEGDGKGKGQ